MMIPSENEDDAKKTNVRPEPLCLFCFPENVPFVAGKTYVNTLREDPVERRAGAEESFRRFTQDVKQREKEEFWLRKRTEARIRRRRTKEPIRHLKSYLLTSVTNEKYVGKPNLPSLFEVLQTVRDAWPSPSTRSKFLPRNETQGLSQCQSKVIMKDKEMSVQTQLLNRRLSVPEALMRKYSVSTEKTSEESETNKTTIEISPSSSSAIETARRRGTEEQKPMMERSNAVTLPPAPEAATTSVCQQTNNSDKGKFRQADLPQRVTQSDYYKQGRRIIKVRAVDTCTCTCQKEPPSSTTVSAKDETDDSGTTESILSSSPTQLPKRESSSGNLSSESDNIRCTCAELSSMETSADLYLSGKSTLSQTVSDKSMSTQDSTVSVNSVSSRGSTVSDNSNSTTPEVERTSAKETTTSPDDSPRTPRNRKNRRRGYFQSHKTCPKHNDAKHSRNHIFPGNGQRCPIHSENPAQKFQTTANAATNTDDPEAPVLRTTDTTSEVAETIQNDRTEQNQQVRAEIPATTEERYKWAKLSQEELYMMQQLRHRRFIESQRKLSSTLPPTPDADSVAVCETGSAYQETQCMEQAIMIPRYSALPRSLSMLVNTSSPDTSHNSDSDNQSLADSLEDQPITHMHKLYFDTKKESKPVRGDVSIMQENKQKHREPRGRAFFVSIKDPYGEDEMLENIQKIPQPPEKIKNQIFKRHLSLCAKHKHFHHAEELTLKKNTIPKGKKPINKNDENEKTLKGRHTNQEESKKERRTLSDNKPKRREDTQTAKVDPTETRTRRKEGKGFPSKIPVLVSSRSTSSSPERDPEPKEKATRPKAKMRREKEDAVPNSHADIETTQILEITHKGTELTLQKPQAVIHPSQVPPDLKPDLPLITPPLVSTLRIPPFRQSWNKQLAPVRRSPIGKFRQRFEVIPEEKSSSLSSAEEKNGRKNIPKFADASTSPVPSEKIHFQSYNVNDVPNLIVAKITSKELETLPYVNNSDSQKIILFSSKPQNSNSSKGRDALIAMNREDFNRLAKGWMNFYKLNENLDNSETEGKSKDKVQEKPEGNTESSAKLSSEGPKTETADAASSKEKKSAHQKELHSTPEVNTQKPPELDENIRFDCSNTILRTSKPASQPTDSGRSLKKQSSLPELKLPGQRTCEMHRTGFSEERKLRPSGRKHEEDDEDDTDSDSTAYMEPPSPRVPPLPIDGIPSDATLSSSDSEVDPPKPQITTQSLKYLQLKRRTATNRNRPKKENSETSHCGKKKNSGWSVTVAGTVELSRSAPDLEMRLSFPASGGPPVVSQSDSGFTEESNYSKLSESLQELDLYTLGKELPSGQKNLKQNWMVTVKKPKPGDAEELRKQFPSKSNHHLPDLETTQSRRNPKKVFKSQFSKLLSRKDARIDERMKRLVERKMRVIWPKVQKVIKREFLTESGRLVTELDDCLDEGSCLSVRGSAVSLERKQKPQTMTERDVTRRYTSRTEN